MANILKCKKCGDIITSDERHDMNWCKCGSIAIDGGDDYCKITGKPEDMEVFVPSKLLTEKEEELQKYRIDDFGDAVCDFAYGEMTKTELWKSIEEQHKMNMVLKQQLAEKENRIEQLETSIRKIEDNKNKEVQQIREFWKQRYKKLDNECVQDKISFAVEQLEKVKEFCDNPKYQVDYEYYTNCWTTAIDKDSFLNEIDDQIKQLKEMK